MTQVDWAESFGGRLVRLRHDRGLTQEQLAALSGLSTRAISSLECGDRHPRRMTVERIAAALQLTAPDRRRLVDAAARPAQLRPESRTAPVRPSIGRHGEIAELRAHLRGDGPPLLVLTGERGIGKSHLLADAHRLATATGLPLVKGACHRGDGPPPALVEVLARHVSGRAGRTERLALLLDDAQWAESETARVLTRLVQGMGRHLRAIVSVRSGDLPPGGSMARCLADLARAGHVSHRTLAPLSDADALQLAGRPDIVDRAGGLPLFLVELATVAEGVPAHLRLAIRQQLADLPAETRALLQRMAAGPVVTSVERLLRGDDTAPAALAALEPAISKRILDDTAAGFRFRYPLFREVLLADLGPTRRSLLRQAMAVLSSIRPLGHVKAI